MKSTVLLSGTINNNWSTKKKCMEIYFARFRVKLNFDEIIYIATGPGPLISITLKFAHYCSYLLSTCINLTLHDTVWWCPAFQVNCYFAIMSSVDPSPLVIKDNEDTQVEDYKTIEHIFIDAMTCNDSNVVRCCEITSANLINRMRSASPVSCHWYHKEVLQHTKAQTYYHVRDF